MLWTWRGCLLVWLYRNNMVWNEHDTYGQGITVFSLKYWTAKNNSKWECLENFREFLTIEPKCQVWTREFYNGSFIVSYHVQLIDTFCVRRSGPMKTRTEHHLSKWPKHSNCSNGRCRSPRLCKRLTGDVSTPTSKQNHNIPECWQLVLDHAAMTTSTYATPHRETDDRTIDAT